MLKHLNKGGLLAPLLFFLTITNVVVKAETLEFFISARNGLNNMGESLKNDLIGESTDKRVIIEFIGVSYSRFYYKHDGIVDSSNINIPDAGNPDALKDFILRANRYADKEKNLIIWDHGNGWYNEIGTFAISYDGNTGNSIGIANGELRNIFKSCYENYGIRFKSITLDACLMGEIEVADEIKEFSKYLVASPAIVPYQTFDYHKLLESGDYFNNLVGVVHKYNEGSNSKFTVINLNNLGKFIADFRQDISELMSMPFEEIVKKVNYYPDKYSGDSVECGLKELIKLSGEGALLSEYNDLILNHEDSADISIFLPSQEKCYLNRIYEYRNTLFNKTVRWDSIVFSMYEKPDSFPPIIEIDSFVKKEGNNVRFNVRDFYDFYSDIFLRFYNLEDYKEEVFYNFENGLTPQSIGWSISSGKSYSGDYSYYSGGGGSILLKTDNKPIFLSFYLNKYKDDMKLTFYTSHGTMEQSVPVLHEQSWTRYAVCDTSNVDSIKLIAISEGGWIFLDNIKVADFDVRHNLGTKEVKNPILFNLKEGNYHVYVQPVDSRLNGGTDSDIFEFDITSKAKPYIWPMGGGINGIRHIVIDDTTALEKFLVFSMEGKRVPIKANLNNRIFRMPDSALFGIYYFVAKTRNGYYKGKFALTR